MATITAIKSGNWSDPTVWDSGTLPQSGDTAKPGGFAVVIDQDVDLGAGALEGTAGAAGYFRVNAEGITITCDHLQNTNGNLLKLYHTTGQVYINANIRCGTDYAKDCVQVLAAGGLTVVGDVTGGSANSSWGINVNAGDVANSPGLHVTGNVTGGTGYGSSGIMVYYGWDITVVGDVSAGPQGAGPLHGESTGVRGLYAKNITVYGTVRATNNGHGVVGSGRVNSYPLLITVHGDVYACDDPDPDALFFYPGISTFGTTYNKVVVHGRLYDGAHGVPAVEGRVFRDVAYPQSYIDLPYIDPATNEITVQRLYHRMPGAVIGSTVTAREAIASILD